MNLIDRAKKIMLNPKEEWVVISQETTTVTRIFTGYLLILAIVPALAQFVRYGLMGYNVPLVGYIGGSVEMGIRYAVIGYASYIFGAFISAYIIDALAISFGSRKNFTKAMQLVVYSYTPMLLASVFLMIPGLSFLSIVGLYGLYLLYIGLSPMMETPEDKAIGYFLISLLVIIVIYFVLAALLSLIFLGRSVFSAM
jgi:hypothetical protein